MAESKMPARIWTPSESAPYSTPYIRADLVEPLVEALRELLRFCDDATDYELTHASSYQPYIDGRAALSSWEAGQ